MRTEKENLSPRSAVLNSQNAAQVLYNGVQEKGVERGREGFTWNRSPSGFSVFFFFFFVTIAESLM